MDKRNWYYKQVVSQSDLDESFDWVEEADLNIVKDLELYGAISGLAVAEQGTPSMNVDVGLGVAYGKDGERIYSAANEVVDCSVDEYGTSTTVGTSGYKKWLSVFLRFVRREEDAEIDGNSLEVYTKQYEDAEIVVRQGSEASDNPSRPALLSNAILLADIYLEYNQTSITTSDIDLTRREDFVRLTPSNYPTFAYGTAKDAITELVDMVDNLAGGGGIAFTPSEQWFGSTDLSGDSPPVSSLGEAIDAIVYDLAQSTASDGGAALVGVKDYTSPTSSMISFDTSVQGALELIAARLDVHASDASVDHAASGIGFDDTVFVANLLPTSDDVQEALDELIARMVATTGTSGSDLIGVEQITDTPEGFAGGTLLQCLTEVYEHINDRIDGQDELEITAPWIFNSSDPLRFNGEPFFNGLAGGSMSPDASLDDVCSQDFSSKNSLAHPFGEASEFSCPFSGTLGVKGVTPLTMPASGTSIDRIERMIGALVSDTGVAGSGEAGGGLRVTYAAKPWIASSLKTLGGLPSSSSEEWYATACCSDGRYVYVKFADSAANPAETHRVQCYDAWNDFAVRSGWPATGTALTGTGVPSIGDGIICAGDSNVACINGWRSTSDSSCVQIINKADGTISNSGRGDASSSATSYPTGAACWTGSEIVYALYDDPNTQIASCDISCSDPFLANMPQAISAAYVIQMVYTGEIAVAVTEPGDVYGYFRDGQCWSYAVGPAGFVNGGVSFDGINIWYATIDASVGGTSPLHLYMDKLPAAAFLTETDGSAPLSIGNAVDVPGYHRVEMMKKSETIAGSGSGVAHTAKGLCCFDGDAIWTVCDNGITGDLAGKIRSIRRASWR